METLSTPYKSYIKTVLSKVYVTVLDPQFNKPEGKILSGNPRSNDENCIVELESEAEDSFFRRKNKRHLEAGLLIEYKRPDKAPERSSNDITNDEIIELLHSKFYTLQHRIEKMTSIAPIFRVLEVAKEIEKSEKIIKFLEGSISALQALEYEGLSGE